MLIPTHNKVFFENDCLIPPKKIPGFDDEYGDTAELYWKNNKRNFLKLIEIAQTMEVQDAKMIIQLRTNKIVLQHLIMRESDKVLDQTNQKIQAEVTKKDLQYHLNEMNKNQDIPAKKNIVTHN